MTASYEVFRDLELPLPAYYGATVVLSTGYITFKVEQTGPPSFMALHPANCFTLAMDSPQGPSSWLVIPSRYYNSLPSTTNLAGRFLSWQLTVIPDYMEGSAMTLSQSHLSSDPIFVEPTPEPVSEIGAEGATAPLDYDFSPPKHTGHEAHTGVSAWPLSHHKPDESPAQLVEHLGQLTIQETPGRIRGLLVASDDEEDPRDGESIEGGATSKQEESSTRPVKNLEDVTALTPLEIQFESPSTFLRNHLFHAINALAESHDPVPLRQLLFQKALLGDLDQDAMLTVLQTSVSLVQEYENADLLSSFQLHCYVIFGPFLEERNILPVPTLGDVQRLEAEGPPDEGRDQLINSLLVDAPFMQQFCAPDLPWEDLSIELLLRALKWECDSAASSFNLRVALGVIKKVEDTVITIEDALLIFKAAIENRSNMPPVKMWAPNMWQMLVGLWAQEPDAAFSFFFVFAAAYPRACRPINLPTSVIPSSMPRDTRTLLLTLAGYSALLPPLIHDHVEIPQRLIRKYLRSSASYTLRVSALVEYFLSFLDFEMVLDQVKHGRKGQTAKAVSLQRVCKLVTKALAPKVSTRLINLVHQGRWRILTVVLATQRQYYLQSPRELAHLGQFLINIPDPVIFPILNKYLGITVDHLPGLSLSHHDRATYQAIAEISNSGQPSYYMDSEGQRLILLVPSEYKKLPLDNLMTLLRAIMNFSLKIPFQNTMWTLEESRHVDCVKKASNILTRLYQAFLKRYYPDAPPYTIEVKLVSRTAPSYQTESRTF